MRIVEVATLAPPIGLASPTGLKVTIYNIAHGRGGRRGASNWEDRDFSDKRERLDRIAALLRDTNADIVVLREVDFSSFWNGHFDQARFIAAAAGYPNVAEQRNVDAAIPLLSVRFGNALLSRYEIVDAQLIRYPKTSRLAALFGGTKDGMRCSVVLPSGETVDLFAVHLTSRGESYRVGSVRQILAMTGAAPTIAMGDFNDAPVGYPDGLTDEAGENAFAIMREGGLYSTLPMSAAPSAAGFSFPSERPDRVIDWVYVTRHWRVAEKRVVRSDLSDHLPVVVRLERADSD